MRRRTGSFDDDSLDLFLDAISNVFGGILFIALAVVVLLQFTVPQVPLAVPDAGGTPAQSEAAAPVLPESLDAALSAAASSSPNRERAEEDQRLREALLAVLAERETLERLFAEQAREAAATETRRLEEASREAELERALQAAQEELQRLEQRPTQRVRAARFRPTAKAEVPLMVLGNRVVRPIGPDGALDLPALRLDEAEQTARPALGAGRAILDGREGDAALAGLLAGLDANAQFLNIAVWPSGFAAARRLRDAAIELGFEFTLTPLPEGEGVPFRAAAGVQ